jgi:hypothetical protein
VIKALTRVIAVIKYLNFQVINVTGLPGGAKDCEKNKKMRNCVEGCTWRLGKRILASEVTEVLTRVIAVWG